MDIQKNVPLHTRTTFQVGGPAAYLTEVADVDELRDAVSYAHSRGLSWRVIGGGSNIVPSDTGFDGLIIVNAITGTTFEYRADSVCLVAGGGENWDELVRTTIAQGLGGIENLSGIPGSVGAAPVQNIGAYGRELADVLEWLEALNTDTGELEIFSAEDCGFDYRWSKFKTEVGSPYVITRVALRLAPDAPLELSYRDLAEYFADRDPGTIDREEVRDAVLSIRSEKFPDWSVYGTAGSFFTNPIVSRERFDSLRADYPEMPGYTMEDGRIKVPAAWILDKICGLRGYRKGPVGLYENQPLVVVNYGGARAADVYALVDDVRGLVKAYTGLDLAFEVTPIG